METYSNNILFESTCRKWFKRFKNFDLTVEEKEREGIPKKFKDNDLEAMLDEYRNRKGIGNRIKSNLTMHFAMTASN